MKELEIWKEVENYPNYMVSNLGRVKSVKRRASHTLSKDGILSATLDGGGYPQVLLYNENGAKRAKVHKLVAKAFLPNGNNFQQIDHKNFDRTDCRAVNLDWCTALENQRRKTIAGRHPHLLSNEDVSTIRHMVACGVMRQYEIAKIYNIDPSHVSKMCSKQRRNIIYNNAN